MSDDREATRLDGESYVALRAAFDKTTREQPRLREMILLTILDTLDARLRVHEPCEKIPPSPVTGKYRGPHRFGDDGACEYCGVAGNGLLYP
jgi:hypothetical protein